MARSVVSTNPAPGGCERRRSAGAIDKIAKSHRCKLSPMGQTLTAALLAARSAPLKHLLRDAA
jgi:hypothetical protein